MLPGDRLFTLAIACLLAAAATGSGSSSSGSSSSGSSCGYSGCHPTAPGRYNVHLVAHTHDDVGWLRTVDQYYYYEVQFILDTVVTELLANSDRKFTYVEIAYFYRWWREQTQERRAQVHRLVQNGQLQFALGGWCMDDEATTHYVDIVDQHTEGLRFLNDTFGDCGRPRVAWQVDPFGHSKEHTALLAQMGFDGLYFGRIDYQDQAARRKSRRMEMLWRGSQDIGSPQADLFSGKLYDSYCAPGGFTYENGDEPVQDDANLYDYNVERKVQEFVAMVNSRRQVFSSDHLMLTMGCDFQYQNARKNFKIYDKLIKAVNARSSQHNISVHYSTPSCYTKAVHDQHLRWTTKTDDFFPYAHIPHGFWTGYFTSRAALKRYVRQVSNTFQAVKQLASLSGIQRDFDAQAGIEPLRQAMGVVQHHDGVSGTEKQVVAYDYALRMASGVSKALPVLLKAWTNLTKDAGLGSMQLCPLANISSCPFTDSHDSFHLHVYNPVSHSVWQLLRLPVRGRYYVVSNDKKQILQSQTIPVSNGTRRVPERRGAKSHFELVFNATDLPAMGFAVFKVVVASRGQPGASTFTPIVEMPSRSPLLRLRPSFDARRRHGIFDKESVPAVAMTMASSVGSVASDMAFYYGFIGNNSKPQFTSSGAYLFRPTKQTPETFAKPRTAQVTGPVVNETHTSWSNWTYQVRRSFGNRRDPLAFEENEMTVGPIPFADGRGREAIVRYDTDVRSAATFFTDANGRQVLRRVRDKRPTWPLQQTEKVAGNYYPINSHVFFNDSSSSFSVITDRSQGGGSVKDGQLEIMLHRVTMHDDSLGVGEALQERGCDGKGLVVKATHWISKDAVGNAARKRRELVNRRYREPVVGFLATEPKVKRWSGLRRPLPPNVQVVSLEDWRGADTKLLRLEHLFQKYEDAELSKPVTLDMRSLFATFDIVKADELTLAANQFATEAQRLRWRSSGSEEAGSGGYGVGKLDGTRVTIGAMQIRTFAVKVKYL